MKKFIVCLILSLIVCLIMAFPAGAVTFAPSVKIPLESRVKEANNALLSKVPSGYAYYAVFCDANGNLRTLLYSNVKTMVQSTILYKPHNEVSNITALNPSGFNANSFSFKDGQILWGFTTISTGVSGTYSVGYYVKELSTADFYSFQELNSSYDILAIFVDISNLESLIATAKAKTNTGYTSASWQALQSTIIDAENLLKAKGYTQTQVDSMVTILQSVINGLVVQPDTTDFEKLVIQMEAVKDIGYTPFSWQTFSNAVVSSRALLNSGNYTQEQITTSSNNLRSAYNSLVLATITPPPDPPPDYQSMIHGFGSEWLTPANAGIWENFGEARKFGLFAFAVMMSALIFSRIIKNALGIETIGLDSQNVDFGLTQEKQNNYDKGKTDKNRRR